MSRIVLAAFACAAVVAMGGCNTPQIPLPPPVIEDLSFMLVDRQSEMGRLSGSGAQTPQMAGATVRVVNLRDDHGVIAPASADGSFETRVFLVRDRDDLEVDYNVDGELSDPVCVTVVYEGPIEACE